MRSGVYRTLHLKPKIEEFAHRIGFWTLLKPVAIWGIALMIAKGQPHHFFDLEDCWVWIPFLRWKAIQSWALRGKASRSNKCCG